MELLLGHAGTIDVEYKVPAKREEVASSGTVGMCAVIVYIVGRGAVRFGYVDNRSSFNDPAVATARPAVMGASFFFKDHYDQQDGRRNAFVGVAISGGGSRAAVFAAEA